MPFAQILARASAALIGGLLGGASALAETAWGTLPSPDAGTRTQLFGVAALGPGATVAVGAYNPGQAPTKVLTQPFAQRWDGSAWQPTPVALPPAYPSQAARLASAAAISASQAWAVGHVEDVGSLSSQTLAYRWDGSTWTRVATPNPAPPGVGNRLHAVVSRAPGEAWAAGETDYPERSLMLRWDGVAWREAATPDLGPLRAIAADSRYVWAASDREVMRFNGRRWTLLAPPPLPPSADQLQLKALAASGGRLWAVGVRLSRQGEGYVAGPYAAYLQRGQWVLLASPPAAGGLVAVVVATDGVVRATSTGGDIVRLSAVGATAEVTPEPGSVSLDAIAAGGDGLQWAVGTRYEVDGTPRAMVYVAPGVGQGGMRVSTGFGQATITWIGPVTGSGVADAQGHFAVGGLPVGGYQIVSSGGNCNPGIAGIAVEAGLVTGVEALVQC